MIRAMIVLAAMSCASAAFASAPIQVSLKGLVCSFCAQGLNQLLEKQKDVEKFEISLRSGELSLWARAPISEARIRDWVEKAGLQVKSIAFPH